MDLDKHSKKLLADPDKRWAWIRYQFQLKGRSLAEVAAEAGVTRQCLYHAHHVAYPRMEKILADALGLAPHELFPERYDQATGLPFYRFGRPVQKRRHTNKSLTKYSRKKATGNVKEVRGRRYMEAA